MTNSVTGGGHEDRSSRRSVRCSLQASPTPPKSKSSPRRRPRRPTRSWWRSSRRRPATRSRRSIRARINVAKKLADGEQYDLVIMSAPAIDEQTKLGKVVAGSKVDFAKSGTGLAVKKGAAKPDIGTVDAFKKTLLTAKIDRLFDRPERRLRRQRVREARHRQRGQAQAQADAVRRVRRHPDRQRRHRDRLPADSRADPLPRHRLRRPAARRPAAHDHVLDRHPHRGAKHTEEAKALVKFLTAPAAAPIISKHGLEPA